MNAIASNIIKKFLGILFLASVAVYSLIYLANIFITWIGNFESAIQWQLATLSALFILSIGSIGIILRGAGNGSFFNSKDLSEIKVPLNYKKLTFHFTCGIIDGITYALNEKNLTRGNNNEL